MTTRESKATANLLTSLKAKSEAKRKYEANRAREKEFDRRCAAIRKEWELELESINIEYAILQKNLDNANKDVKLALTATSNESLTLQQLRLRLKLRNPVSKTTSIRKPGLHQMNNVSLAIHASVVVNFGSHSAFASVLGFHGEHDVIVQLSAPLADGSLAAVVGREALIPAPQKVARRPYDTSLSKTLKLLADFAGASAAKNKVKGATDNLRVICADMTQADTVASFLRSNGYSVTRHPTSRIEFTCTAGAVSTSVEETVDSDSDESEAVLL